MTVSIVIRQQLVTLMVLVCVVASCRVHAAQVPVEPVPEEVPDVQTQVEAGDSDRELDTGPGPIPSVLAEPAYPITRILLQYADDHSGLPLLLGARQIPIELGVAPDGSLASPHEGLQTVTLLLIDLRDDQQVVLRASAIDVIASALVRWFNAQDIIGVYVTTEGSDVDPFTREDLRPADRQSLRLVIRVGRVTSIATIGSGSRFQRTAEGSTVNLPQHEPIIENSPIQPWEGSGERRDLLRARELDDYVLRFSRHPNRRVDVAVAAGAEPNEAELQYLVRENRPWSLFAQVSNTGTSQTGEWRQRLGFSHTQLTGRDDIFQLDYITASFDGAQAVVASYDTPLGSDRVRFRGSASYSEFQASDVGAADETFSGESVSVGGDVRVNVFQRRELFVDVYGGVRWSGERIRNDVIDITGDENFLLPRVGVSVERRRDTSSLFADAHLEFSLPGISATSAAGVERLGRIDVSRDWYVLRGQVEGSTFLEPLLDPLGWRDVSTPETSTLAHEIAASLRWQYAIDSRLIPSSQFQSGGFYSVRGYPESAVSGDSGVIGSAEYRYYFARSLPVEPEPRRAMGQKFRFAPPQPYGQADWDLILRAFTDVGFVTDTRALSFEGNDTLIGAGVGAELRFGRSVGARVDLAFPLRDLESAGVKSWDGRVHFSLTVVY
ncbi:MAG: hypothetical protein NCW75_03840 [Phycisphaera sp.]|nr:MAG: hypothetical protein NCW75_03840 [Phycisphaera sp.]